MKGGKIFELHKFFFPFFSLVNGAWHLLAILKLHIYYMCASNVINHLNLVCFPNYFGPKETIEYQDVNSICYGLQQVLHLFFKVRLFQTWAIVHETIINMLLPIVKLCVWNQSKGNWLLVNAFFLPSFC